MAPVLLPTGPAPVAATGVPLMPEPSAWVRYHESEAQRHLAAAANVRQMFGLAAPAAPAAAPMLPAKRKRANVGCPKGTTPKGFVKDMRITSPLLAEMIGHDASTPIPRQQVAHALIRYMKDHGLQRESNKKMIDASGESEAARNVRELFGPETDWDNLNFFNMQKLLRPLMEDFGPVPVDE